MLTIQANVYEPMYEYNDKKLSELPYPINLENTSKNRTNGNQTSYSTKTRLITHSKETF